VLCRIANSFASQKAVGWARRCGSTHSRTCGRVPVQYTLSSGSSDSGHSSTAWPTKLAQHVRVSPFTLCRWLEGGLHACGCLPLQLLQGELDSLKAERGKAQRKTLEVG
jgi:hypothetical protein